MKALSRLNLFENLPENSAGEHFQTLCQSRRVRVERIVSRGHASPEDFWYDQDEHEFVLMMQGRAGLILEGNSEELRLQAGDCLLIPAHCRHRVAWTAPEQDTIWLAVHFR